MMSNASFINPYQDLESLPIRDFVVPLGNVLQDGTFRLQGTGFMLGSGGLLMTAGHVSRELQATQNPVALFVTRGKWQAINLNNFEEHAVHDVAVISIGGQGWGSIHQLSTRHENASADIHIWGYPEHVAHDVRRNAADPVIRETGVNPDLIFYKGYIRRRISRELSTGVLTGNAFYEISEVCGSCCSGAPVVVTPAGGAHEVCGIYIGEETGAARTAVGIVVRVDALVGWVPKIAGMDVTTIVATHY